MKILVTGGAGFIGSALCRRLVSRGAAQKAASVLNVDKLTYAGHRSSLEPIAASPRYGFLKADICDGPRIADAIISFEPDAILHLAAESHVDRSIAGPAPFIETNITGTYTLLEAAARYAASLPSDRRTSFRFVHVSTDEVFGSLGPEGAFRETSPADPSSPYSASKAAADHLVMAWHRTYGLPAMVLNCSNAYGPYQSPEKLTPLMITRALDGRTLPIYGDGQNVRDWMHVEDFVSAILAVLERGRPGERYAAGARSELTNLDVVERICAALDAIAPGDGPRKRLITFVADRPGHDRRYAIDPSKIELELGWRPVTPYDTGLAETVRWYMANPQWWRPLQ